MINVNTETLLTIAQATKAIPGRPHPSTIWRWIQRGVRGTKLATVLIGGRRYTSKQALASFFQRATSAAEGSPAISDQTSSERRWRHLDAVESELAADGV